MHPQQHRSRRILGGIAAAGLGILGLWGSLTPAPARADASGFEFRWDSDKDYRKLYYYISSSKATQTSDYYLILSPKDRNTALLKLAIGVPKDFDARFDPKQIQLCYMTRGSITRKTQCDQVIPAAVEVSADNTAIELFPSQPVPVGKTIGVLLRINNPFNPGMYQFNVLAQAPGDIPISGYLGSWLIDITPNN